jgi:hypothetical protein
MNSPTSNNIENLSEVKLLSTKEASEISGYHSDYIARLCRSGKISGKQVGKNWLVSHDSLLEFVKSQDARKKELSQQLSKEREQEYQKYMARAEGSIPRTVRKISPLFLKITTPADATLEEKMQKASAFQKSSRALLATLVVMLACVYGCHAAMQSLSTAAQTLSLQTNQTEGPTLGRTFGYEPQLLASAFFSSSALSSSSALPSSAYEMYADTGEFFYSGITNFMSQYLAGIQVRGAQSLAVGTFISDTGEHLPEILAYGAVNAIPAWVHLSQGIMHTYTSGIYAWVDVTSQAPGEVGLAVYDIGSVVADATASIPGVTVQGYQLAMNSYVNGTNDLGLSIIDHEIAFGNSAMDTTQSVLLAERNAEMPIRDGAIAFATEINGSNRLLASVQSSGNTYSFGQQVALATYFTLHNFFESSSSALATILSGNSASTGGNLTVEPNTLALGTPENIGATSTQHIYPSQPNYGNEYASGNSYGNYHESSNNTSNNSASSNTTSNVFQTVVQGVSQSYVDQAIANLSSFLSSQNNSDHGSNGTAGGIITPAVGTDNISSNDSNFVNTIVTNATTTNATTTNSFITNSVIANATTTNNFATNLFATNVNTTNATSTNLFATLANITTGSISNLTSNLATIFGLTATNATTTNATSTNAFATNLTATNATLANATSTNLYSSIANIASGTITNLNSTLGTITGLIATNATSTNLYSSNITTPSATIGALSLSNLNGFLTASSGSVTSTPTVNLANQVAGTLLVTNGGTGTSTGGVINGIDYYNGSNLTNNSGFVYSGGNVGIGTSSPSQTLSVQGNGYISGNLTVGNNFSVINGSVNIGSSTGNVAVSGTFDSNLVPSVNNTYNLGSPALFWNNLYANNIDVNSISAASTSIAGTQSTSFTINTANSTHDTEAMNLIFFRGVVNPNAVISWNPGVAQFQFNQPAFFDNQSSTSTIVTLAAQASPGQTADIFHALDSSGNVVLNATSNDLVGIGSSTPATTLSVAGSGYLTGGLGVGALNTTPGSILATGNATFGSLTVGSLNGLLYGNNGAVTAASVSSPLVFNSGTLSLGTVPVANGGTGSTTLSGILVGNGTSPVSSLTVGTGLTLNGTTLSVAGIVGPGTVGQIPYYAANGSAITATSSIFLAPSGNVGIGTTSPAYPLDLGTGAVQTRLGPALVGSWPALPGYAFFGNQSLNQTSTGNYALLQDTTGNTFLNAAALSNIYFRINNGTAMTINSSGNVGIGTTTPNAPLQVQGSGNTQIFAGKTGTTGYLAMGANSATVSQISAFRSDSPYTAMLALNPDGGNVGIGTTSPATALAVAGSGYFTGGLGIGAQNTTAGTLVTTGNASIGGQLSVKTMTLNDIGSQVYRIGSTATGGNNQFQFYDGNNDNTLEVFGANSANEVQIAGNGPSFFNGGNVGIGTTTPGSTLSVAGASYTSGSASVGNLIDSGIAANSLTYLNSSQQLAAVTLPSYITLTSGTLGINSLPVANGGTGSTTLSGILVGNGTSPVKSLTIGNGLSLSGTTLSVAGLIGSGTVGQIPYYAANGTALTATSSLFLAASGNVGIGTTSPATALAVAGSGYFSGGLGVGEVNTTPNTIDVSQYGSYKQAGQTIVYASSTNQSLAIGIGAGGNILTSANTSYNVAVGNGALNLNTTGVNNAAVGYGALYAGGSYNSALGLEALYNNTGYNNNAIGDTAMFYNTSGYDNTAIGNSALFNNTGGSENTAIGLLALYFNSSANNDIAIGNRAAYGNGSSYSNQGGVYIGNGAGSLAQTGSDYNTFVGYNSGYGDTSGNRNVLIGQSTISASQNQVTTGSDNIAIGNDVALPSAIANNQLDIGNLIYGTGLNGTGSTLSTGNIGIGNNNPGSLLTIGNNAAITSSGNATFAGSIGLGGASPNSGLAGRPNLISGVVSGTASSVFIQNNSANGWNEIDLENDNNAIAGLGINGSTESNSSGSPNGAYFFVDSQGNSPASNFTFRASGNVYFINGSYGTAAQTVITATGVGIGTTSPGSELSVAGASYTSGSASVGNLIDTGVTANSLTYLNSSQKLAAATLPAYLTLTSGSLAISNLPNAQLQNSTISGVALGGNLNALTATNGTLTFSGSYNGSAAQTIGLNLANPNTFTGLQQFNGNASTTGLTVSGNSFFNTTNTSGTATVGNLIDSALTTNALTYSNGSDQLGSVTVSSPLAFSAGTLSLGTVGAVNGGTGSTTLSGILVGNGTNPINSLTVGTGLSLSGTTLNATGGTVGNGTTGQFPYYAANGTALTATSSLYLGTNGTVGIGTTTLLTYGGIPDSLDLNSNLRLTGSSYLILNSQATAAMSADNLGNLYEFTGTNSYYYFNVGGSYKATINSLGMSINNSSTGVSGSTGFVLGSGNAGFGTTTPSTALSVAGSGYFTGGLGVGALNTTAGTLLTTGTTTVGSLVDTGITANSLPYINGSQQLAAATLPSYLTLTSGTLAISNLPNTALANSTISGVALGSNLANLSATNSTLTFSGSYNGSLAQTIGINLGNADTWSALQTFGAGFVSQASSTVTGAFNVGGQAYFGGNVGIGTTSPGSLLSIGGSGSGSAVANFSPTTSTIYSKLSLTGGNLTIPAETPTEVSSITTGLNNPQTVFVSGRYAYVVDSVTHALVIFDVSNPASSTEISSISTGLSGPKSVFVSGRYAYVADYANHALVTFDISNPANPTEVSSISSGLSFPNSVYVSGRYAYVADLSNSALVIFDISNPASPVKTSSISTGLSAPSSVYVSGRYAYVANEGPAALVTFDISNPANPTEASSISTGLSQPTSVYVSGRYAYVADSNSALVTFDISNPTTPAEVSSISTGIGSLYSNSVYVSGRYAYFTNYNNGTLFTFDISNPTTPTQVSSISTGLSKPSFVFVSGRYAYVTDSANHALVTFDVGGEETNALIANSLEAGNLQVRNDITAQGQLAVSGGITANGLNLSGPFSLTASTPNATTTATQNYSIFSLNTASSTAPLFNVLYNGNIGIGTSSPSSLLSIAGSGYLTGGLGIGAVDNTPGTLLTTGNATVGSLTVGSLNGLLYANNGAVSTSTVSSPLAFSAGTLSLGTVGLANGGTGTTTGGVTNGVEYYNGTTLTNDANLTHSGLDLSIDTSSQLAPLTIGYPTTGTVNLIEGLATNNGTNPAFMLSSDANGRGTLSLYMSNSKNVYLSGWNGENSYINSGNLGIGTTSPSHLLEVDGATPGTLSGGQLGIYATDALGANKGGQLVFGGSGFTSNQQYPFASIAGKKVNAVSSDIQSYLQFNVENTFGGMNEAMRIVGGLNGNTIGFVGIGTTTPLSALTVGGTGGESIGADYNFAAPTNGLIVEGNVGIGTTTPQNALTVAGTTENQGLQIDGSNYYNAYDIARNGGNGVLTFTGNQTGGASGYAFSTPSAASAFTILNSGNVGIGTTTPGSALSVAGSGYISGNLSASGNINVAAGSAYTYNGQNVITASTTLYNYFFGGAGNSSMTGNANTALGSSAFYSDTTGNANTAIGYNSLSLNTTGTTNTAIGVSALSYNTTGSNNVVVGSTAMNFNVSATSTVAIGASAGFGAIGYSNQGGTYIGTSAGFSLQTRSDYNTFLGYQAGYGVTSGAGNILLGAASTTANANLTSGYGNIAIGNNISLPSATASGQLDIGNIIYGTGLNGTGSTLSTGNIGIGTTTPGSLLSIGGSGSGSAVANFGPTTSTIYSKLTLAGDNLFIPSATTTTTKVSSISTGLSGPSSVFVSGRYAYVADLGNHSLVIFDMSNPASPTKISSISAGLSQPISVYVSGRYAYVVDEGTHALVIFDVSNPASPTEVSSISSGLTYPDSVYVSGRYAYVAEDSGALVIFDVSNPASATEVSSVSTGLSNPFSVYVSGRYAYVADYGAGALVTFDISNPASPTKISSISSGLTNPNSVYVSGRYAYVLNNGATGSLVTFDISNPASPTQISSISTGLSYPQSVFVSGRYAYVASNGNSSLVTFDISSSTSPVEAGSISTGLTYPASVYVSGRYAYVANDSSGALVTFDVGGEETNALIANSLEAGNLQVKNDITAQGQLAVSGGITANGLNLSGPFSLTASTPNATTTATQNYSIFSLNTASSTAPLFTALYNGNIGIGTSTPGQALSVVGTVEINRANTQELRFNGDAGAQWRAISTINGSTNGSLQFQNTTDNFNSVFNQSLTLATNGSVGIGTTTPVNKLSLGGGLDVEGAVTIPANEPGLYVGYQSNVGSITSINNGSAYKALTIDASTIELNAASGGNVGIGTTTPNSLLTVSGNAPTLNIADTATSGTAKLQLSDASGDNYTIARNNSTGFLNFNGTQTTFSGYNFQVGNAATSSLTIINSGYVGIGNTSPTSKLHIYGGTGQTVAALTDAGIRDSNLAIDVVNGNTGAGGSISFGNAQSILAGSLGFAAIKGYLENGGGKTTGDIDFATRNATTDTALTQRMTIQAAGNIGIGTPNPLSLLHIQETSNSGIYIARFTTSDYVDGSIGSGLLFNTGATTGNTYTQITAGTSGFAAAGNLILNGNTAGNVGIGTTTPVSKLTVAGSACISQGTGATVACGTTAGNIYYKAANTGNYDVAENYLADNSAATVPGTIVALDPSGNESITTASAGASGGSGASGASAEAILGVVSTNPGLVLGGADASTTNQLKAPVALSGRVPVSVSMEGGPISVGDRIALSSTPGVGMKAKESGETVGIALQSASAAGKIDVFVQPQYYFDPGELSLTAAANTVSIGSGTAGINGASGASAGANAPSATNLAVSGNISSTNITASGAGTFTGALSAASVSAPIFEESGAGSTFSQTFSSLTINGTSATSVLTTDGTGVDIYKLAYLDTTGVQKLTTQMSSLISQTTLLASTTNTLSSTTSSLSSQLLSMNARVSALEAGAAAASASADVASSTSGTDFLTATSSALASAMQSFGILLQNGVAQFDTLVARDLVFSKDSNGSSAAGSGEVLAGNTTVQITNSHMLASSDVSVTLTSPMTGSWYVTNKQDGSFQLTFSAAQPNIVTFDYFIVQTQGQIATSTPDTAGNPFSWLANFLGGSSSSTNTSNSNTSVSGDSSAGAESGSGAGIGTSGSGESGTGSGSSTNGSAGASSSSANPNAPKVTLNGAAAIAVLQGSLFTDPGAAAVDASGTDITSSIVETGTVDTNTVGLYTLTYTATDSQGNSANVSRVVSVTSVVSSAPSSGGGGGSSSGTTGGSTSSSGGGSSSGSGSGTTSSNSGSSGTSSVSAASGSGTGSSSAGTSSGSSTGTTSGTSSSGSGSTSTTGSDTSSSGSASNTNGASSGSSSDSSSSGSASAGSGTSASTGASSDSSSGSGS